jgi:aldose 1-epimerase
MYNIKHNQDLNILEIEDSNELVYGKIHLNNGASLQELTLNGIAIIQDLSPLDYRDTYASSILFPVANRIKDGSYSFKGKKYQFEINQKEENNALHGLVYNKNFSIISKETNNDSATITLEYIEKKKSIGFPYTFSIQLKYIFTNDNLNLIVSVKNTDSEAFPYTIGWHPYFVSEDLQKSTLSFNSNQKLIIGDRNITTGIEEIKVEENFDIEDKQLDDCWILNSNQVKFNTPKFQLIIDSSAKNNFLQAYTPPKLNTIAIEPTTGVSDSFNNKIGLEILNPEEIYKVKWGLKIINKQS